MLELQFCISGEFMAENLFRLFHNIRVHRAKGKSARHKPLLALWAIGQCLQGRNRLIEFAEVEKPLKRLLVTFGETTNKNPHVPFLRMRADRVWEVPKGDTLKNCTSSGDALIEELRKDKVTAGFTQEIYDRFRIDRRLAYAITWQLLQDHIPVCDHVGLIKAAMNEEVAQEVLVASGEEVHYLTRQQKIDSWFRADILAEYHHSCAVCGYSVEFPDGHWPGLEAAHIKWRSHKGPDETPNGIALCVLHRTLFDQGLFTIEPKFHHVLVSDAVRKKFLDQGIVKTQSPSLEVIPTNYSSRPCKTYLKWHNDFVFHK